MQAWVREERWGSDEEVGENREQVRKVQGVDLGLYTFDPYGVVFYWEFTINRCQTPTGS
jgi:hypothetical protein